MTTSSPAPIPDSALQRLIRRFVPIERAEVPVVGWSWLYLFSVFFAYSVIKPVRDEVGVASGINNLPWLFTGTLIGMMIANPAFAALVARLPRSRFIGITYRFFIANLLIFLALFETTTGETNLWVGRIFFIWVSIFNLFVVSVFWAFTVDIFTNDQSRRLFGFISVAATVGGILGAFLTASAVQAIGIVPLFLASALLLEIAVFSSRRLGAITGVMQTRAKAPASDAPVGGGALAGLTNALKSPYLLNVCLYMFLYTILSTFLYFQQAAIVDRTFADRAARTAFFAQVDLLVNVLTVFGQLFITGAAIKRFGVAVTLAAVPLITMLGFGAIGLAPVAAVVVALIVLRRSTNYVFARPSRELLFTPVSREDKYKTKNFIDTVVYRLGDQVGAWSQTLLAALGLGISGVAWVAVGLSAVWVVGAWWLGKRQEALARDRHVTVASPA